MAYFSPMRSPRQDCGTRLLRQLGDIVGEGATIHRTASESWASGLFIGTRHSITITLTGADAAERVSALSQSLPDAEFAISGHIVADLAIEDHGVEDHGVDRLHISVLTITED